jgi:anti-sigma regulatory factor (Ser/Thr protein kinase)
LAHSGNLVFAARRFGYGDRGVERSEQTWPARPEHVGAARRAVWDAAIRAGAEEQVREAAQLAVSEAVSNVVVHGYRDIGTPGGFTLCVEWDGGELRVIVRDQGCGMAPRMDSPGAGLGLPLIANLAGSFSVSAPPGGGTELCMTFPLLKAA